MLKLAGHLVFNSGSNESRLAPQFKWLEYTFKCCFVKKTPDIISPKSFSKRGRPCSKPNRRQKYSFTSHIMILQYKIKGVLARCHSFGLFFKNIWLIHTITQFTFVHHIRWGFLYVVILQVYFPKKSFIDGLSDSSRKWELLSWQSWCAVHVHIFCSCSYI